MILKKTIQIIYGVLILLLATSCSRHETKPWIGSFFQDNAPEKIKSSVNYADGFDIYKWDGITRIVVYHPELRELVVGEYYLARAEITQGYKDTANMITLPVSDVAVLSSTQLNAFEKLGKLEMIKGVSEVSYIINPGVQKRIESGEIIELAGSGHFFIERTLEVNPSLIFYSPYKITESHALDVTEIPLIPFYDYFETDPLGRAEWIKFTAAFCSEEDKAGNLFNEIKNSYDKYRKMTENLIDKPTVFSDKYFNGQWYIPGGESYIAKLFEDAGANYLWKDDPHNASFPLDYEVVFGKAYNADYWRIIGSYGDDATYEGLKKENELYEHFKAFKDHSVIYCNAEQTAYFENSPLEPEILLADLIKAFHPELLPDYAPKYYTVIP